MLAYKKLLTLTLQLCTPVTTTEHKNNVTYYILSKKRKHVFADSLINVVLTQLNFLIEELIAIVNLTNCTTELNTTWHTSPKR